MYEELPGVFEFARVMMGVDDISLRYDDYLEYKRMYESLSNTERYQYMMMASDRRKNNNTYVIKTFDMRIKVM